MLLPQSIGMFARLAGADVYAQNQVYPFYADKCKSDEFGISAFYDADCSTLTVTVGPRTLDLSTVTTGSVGLYRVLDARNDYLIRQTAVSADMLRDDNSWIIRFANIDSCDSIYVGAALTVTGFTVYSVAAAQQSAAPELLDPRFFKPYAAKGISDKDPLQTVPVFDTAVDADLMWETLELDFDKSIPLQHGTGTLTYAGGGSRYLPTSTGPVLQAKDKAPWLMNAPLFIEPAGGNLIPGYALNNTIWSCVGTNNVTAEESFFDLSGFNERMVGWSISGANKLNSEMRIDFEPVAWTGDTITGSVFATFESDGSTKAWLGVTRYDSSKTIVDTSWVPFSNENLETVSATWVKPRDTLLNGSYIGLSLRVTDINLGGHAMLVVGFPVLEYTGCACTKSTGSRSRDIVTFAPSYEINSEYGRFDIAVSPNYNGIPGSAGAQLFFDTRDENGLNGFWLGHRPDGILEFGAADSTGSVYVRSTSVVQMSEEPVQTITCFYDTTTKNMRIDYNGVVAVDTTLNTMTVPNAIALIRFGTRFSDTESGSFCLHKFSHQQTPE